ncbi:response regulator [Rhodoflexus caldus]|uniref:response regulator n=1 Tax=Rhodoflexus caldus TaxID=2891236 RepID=UPI00202A6996|nr:response regulator [Rhodoflexus caldus]
MSHFQAQSASAERMNILIVEDDMINAFIFQKYLAADYNVYLADNIAKLSGILQQTPIDLILMDINLDTSDENGIELLQKLRSNYPTQQFKAIALTAFAEEEYEKICKEANFNAFCRKPLTKEKLLGVVKNTLKQP